MTSRSNSHATNGTRKQHQQSHIKPNRFGWPSPIFINISLSSLFFMHSVKSRSPAWFNKLNSSLSVYIMRSTCESLAFFCFVAAVVVVIFNAVSPELWWNDFKRSLTIFIIIVLITVQFLRIQITVHISLPLFSSFFFLLFLLHGMSRRKNDFQAKLRDVWH